ncbi:MAG: hypothetical protein J6573_07430 [Lactobacillus sp.]|nr:hypothetical protein [Lactobacillus sp.]
MNIKKGKGNMKLIFETNKSPILIDNDGKQYGIINADARYHTQTNDPKDGFNRVLINYYDDPSGKEEDLYSTTIGWKLVWPTE